MKDEILIKNTVFGLCNENSRGVVVAEEVEIGGD